MHLICRNDKESGLRIIEKNEKYLQANHIIQSIRIETNETIHIESFNSQPIRAVIELFLNNCTMCFKKILFLKIVVVKKIKITRNLLLNFLNFSVLLTYKITKYMFSSTNSV